MVYQIYIRAENYRVWETKIKPTDAGVNIPIQICLIWPNDFDTVFLVYLTNKRILSHLVIERGGWFMVIGTRRDRAWMRERKPAIRTGDWLNGKRTKHLTNRANPIILSTIWVSSVQPKWLATTWIFKSIAFSLFVQKSRFPFLKHESVTLGKLPRYTACKFHWNLT